MHHSERPDNEMMRKLRDAFEAKKVSSLTDEYEKKIQEESAKMKLGATGEFPGGQLTQQDEGEIKIAVGAVDGKVVINFGKPVAWIGLDAKQARQLAESLRQKSYDV